MLVQPTPRVLPVVEDLTPEHMSSDPPDVTTGVLRLEMIVTGCKIVKILHFERNMVETGLRVQSKHHDVMIHVSFAAVDTVEAGKQLVGIILCVNIVRTYKPEVAMRPFHGAGI